MSAAWNDASVKTFHETCYKMLHASFYNSFMLTKKNREQVENGRIFFFIFFL